MGYQSIRVVKENAKKEWVRWVKTNVHSPAWNVMEIVRMLSCPRSPCHTADPTITTSPQRGMQRRAWSVERKFYATILYSCATQHILPMKWKTSVMENWPLWVPLKQDRWFMGCEKISLLVRFSWNLSRVAHYTVFKFKRRSWLNKMWKKHNFPFPIISANRGKTEISGPACNKKIEPINQTTKYFHLIITHGEISRLAKWSKVSGGKVIYSRWWPKTVQAVGILSGHGILHFRGEGADLKPGRRESILMIYWKNTRAVRLFG